MPAGRSCSGLCGNARRTCNSSARAGEPVFERGEHGIEALDVPDLEDEPALLREVAEFARLLGRLGERLLDEHMFAAFEQRFGDGEMRDGGRGHGRGVNGLGEVLQPRESLRAVLRGDGAGDFRTLIEHGGELRVRQPGENARVVFAHAAGADDAETNGGGVDHGFHGLHGWLRFIILSAAAAHDALPLQTRIPEIGQ